MRKNIKGWNVMCNVSKIAIDVDNYMGILHTPEMNYPDMRRTIDGFMSVDPEIKRIDVFVNNVPDIMYLKELSGEWRAIRLEAV